MNEYLCTKLHMSICKRLTISAIYLAGITSASMDDEAQGGLEEKLCSEANFTPNKWLTVGRIDPERPPQCPLVGEYTGVIPDASGLCAKSYADCNNPEIMFYTVYNCANSTEVYEEREYRCFGQWEEPETGLVYTYTERRDILGYECFVGLDIDEDRNIVTEAGSNCERGHQPRKYGMTLQRIAKCSSSDGSSRDRVVAAKDPSVPHSSSSSSGSSTTTTASRHPHRPVSPRVKNVWNSSSSSSSSRTPAQQPGLTEIEHILEEIERQQEKSYFDREMAAAAAAAAAADRRGNRRKPPSIRGGGYGGDDQVDIFSNEIPDSSSSRFSRASSGLGLRSSALAASVSLFVLVVRAFAY